MSASMSAPAIAEAGTPTLRIRGRPYPVLLPTLRDARLHLAAVIVSLQVLGQVALDFQLSIAQILVSLITCAVLEVGIAFWRHHVLLWPASALLTGNGVAFVLRVPGTEHGDWWSMNGWWIFAGTAAVALLSKHLIRFRGRHIFNPSNFGLVLCFLLLGAERADPLVLWWGPMSPALALAVVLIVGGGIAILRRLHLLVIAVVFWITFAAGIGVLALSGHEMTAPWHLGPLSGLSFWWVLVSSPEILVFLFFMITDPKTIPDSRGGRLAYSVGVALLATVLIAPQTSEFATKVAILSALFLACAARPVAILLGRRGFAVSARRLLSADDVRTRGIPRAGICALALTAAAACAGLVILAGIPARPAEAAPTAAVTNAALPEVTVVATAGLAAIDGPTSRRVARDVVADLRAEEDALRRGKTERAKEGATGAWLAELWRRIGTGSADPPVHSVRRLRLTLRPGDGQAPPIVVATLSGTWRRASDTSARDVRPLHRTVELVLVGNRYLISASRGGVPIRPAVAAPTDGTPHSSRIRLEDVAVKVGLDFRQAAFRLGVSTDTGAMMGGGLCWLDYDNDGWLDLYVTNSYSAGDYAQLASRRELPRSALFHNVHGHFVDVSRGSGADLPVRASGCVAADFDNDGNTDLYVTTTGYSVPTDGYDALLWGDGDGTFTEGARDAGINTPGWHAGAAAGDVNGDGWIDIAVTGYTDPNGAIPGSSAGYPGNHLAVEDRLYLNEGPGAHGRPTFRDVAAGVGVERRRVEHGLGIELVDVDGDGRLDIYVANDTDPDRLYLNRPAPGPLGFEFVEEAKQAGVADPNAGMGIAAADVSGDGRLDLLVSNSRGQLHGVYRSLPPGGSVPHYADARAALADALGTTTTGWGASWADLDLDGDLDLVMAAGLIPVTNVQRDAQRTRVLETVASQNGDVRFVDVTATGLRAPRVNGRGLAVADFDNDGDPDVAINSVGGRLQLLRNSSAHGHWLEVAVRPALPGTRVTAVLSGGRRLVRWVAAGSSYLSSEDPRVHFGLGKVGRVTVLVVRYPGGREVRLDDVAADRIVTVGR
jgi:Na+-transporting NADH:ubiquinone oxidoreductase subunit NqrB